MARTEIQIHVTELLIALEYLIKYSDKDNPAVILDICRYARDRYGLKFSDDSKKTGGDEIKRQRVKQELDHVMYLSLSKYGDSFPFILKNTNVTKVEDKKTGETKYKFKGKYYIDKYYFSEDEIVKIIAAIRNDKFTKDLDTKQLEKNLLHLLANIFNEETILTKVDALTKNVRKYDKTLTKKLELLNKALKEDKIILLRMPQAYINKDGKVISEVLNVWCRVYQIKEYRNKPFAILLPISKSGLICKPIEDLPIPLDVDSGRLLDEDPEKNRDLDKTFQKNNPQFSVWNPTIEKFLESAKKPSLNGWLLIATIYYKYKVRESVCYSFTEYFNAELPYNRCTLEAIKKFNRQKNIYIDDDPKGDYCYSMITIDSHSFKSWLMSEFSESSELTVGEVVGVLEPIYVKKLLARRYQTLAKRYESFLKVSDEVGSK